MHISLSGKNIYKFVWLAWATLCISFFIYSPGKVSFVHWSDLNRWQLLASKLGRIEFIPYTTDFLRAFIVVNIFSLACISLGGFILKLFTIKNNTILNSSTLFARLALLGTAFLIGQALFSVIFLTLSGLYQLTAVHVILVLSISFLLGADITYKRLLLPLFDLALQDSFDRKDSVILWLSISTLFLSLLYSSARISYDSSAVYFSDAKVTAITNHVQFFTDAIFLVSALQTSMPYVALIQLFGDQAARMFSWVCGILIIIFSMALAERVALSKRARLILLALLVTSTAFLDLMGDGKVDLTSTVPAIAAVYWIIVECQSNTPRKSILILIGFLSGLAMVERPFNIFLLAIFLVLFYFQRALFEKNNEAPNYKLLVNSLFWIDVSIFGWGVYHLFANWMILGDPFSFLLSTSKLMPATGPWDYAPQQILTIRLLYPLVATFYNSPQSLGNISPIFVAFLPALLIQSIRKQTKMTKQLCVLCIIATTTLLLWIFLFFTVYEIRYVLFLWAIIFMPVAEAIATMLGDEDHRFRNVLGILVVGLLVFTIVRVIYISIDTYSPIDAQGNPQCSDSRFCEYLKSINNAASPGDRVLTLSAFRYYLRSDLFACSTRNMEYKTLQELSSQDPEAFWKEVYRQGYKYIAYENDYTTRHLQFALIPSPSNTPEWLELEPLFGTPGDLQVAYKINVSNPPIQVETLCQEDSSKRWEIRHLVP